MGSPASPTETQYRQLEKAGGLKQLGEARSETVRNGNLPLSFSLPGQGVSFVKIDW
jgi:xylan 1,4-beta-xylosidase